LELLLPFFAIARMMMMLFSGRRRVRIVVVVALWRLQSLHLSGTTKPLLADVNDDDESLADATTRMVVVVVVVVSRRRRGALFLSLSSSSSSSSQEGTAGDAFVPFARSGFQKRPSLFFIFRV